MWRRAVLVSVLTVVPSFAAAQQPCTTDERQVIEQVYRQVLERSADPGASVWVDRLSRGTPVREIMRGIAKSPEHMQRFGSQSRDGMIVDMYRHLLNRGPDPEGMRNAGMFVSTRGSASLIDRLIDSPEYEQRFGDWTVPGSSVRYCTAVEQNSRQASSRPREDENTMRIRAMDTNRDGVISRSEWRGSPLAFTARDGNNDGVLTSDEVGVAVPRQSRRRWPD
jgi:hypothetical protein